MTHDSFAVSDEVLSEFTAQTGYTVRILRAGDAGSMLNQAILAKDNPLADVLYGVDNTFLTRALDAGIFEAYESPALSGVPAELQLDPTHRVTPVDYGDVCINYDKEAFPGTPAPPASLRDLTKAEYRDMLVVQDPATSSPGLAFLLATIAEFGESGPYSWKDFWRDLQANGVRVVSGWEEAYYSNFSGGAGEGDRPLVVSYASSPPAEVVFAETELPEAPTAAMSAGAFRQVEFVGVLVGAKNPAGARSLIDFMLSRPFQEDMPLQMFVFPANSQAQLPEVFTANASVPAQTSTMDPVAIGKDRERWIEEWSALRIG